MSGPTERTAQSDATSPTNDCGPPRLLLKKRRLQSEYTSTILTGRGMPLAAGPPAQPSVPMSSASHPEPAFSVRDRESPSSSGNASPLKTNIESARTSGVTSDYQALAGPSGSKLPSVSKKRRLLEPLSAHSAASLATSSVNSDKARFDEQNGPSTVLKRMSAFQPEPSTTNSSPSNSGSESGGSPRSFSAARTTGFAEAVAGPSGSSKPKSVVKKRRLMDREETSETPQTSSPPTDHSAATLSISSTVSKKERPNQQAGSSAAGTPPLLKKKAAVLLRNDSEEKIGTKDHYCGFCSIHGIKTHLKGHVTQCKFRRKCYCYGCVLKRDRLAINARKVAERRKESKHVPKSEPIGKTITKLVLKPMGPSRLLTWKKIWTFLKKWRFHENAWPLVHIILKHVTGDVVRIGEEILESYSDFRNVEIDQAALGAKDESLEDSSAMIPLVGYHCWWDGTRWRSQADVAIRSDPITKPISETLVPGGSPVNEHSSAFPATPDIPVHLPSQVWIASDSLGSERPFGLTPADSGRLGERPPYTMAESHLNDRPPPLPPPFNLGEAPPPPFVSLRDVHHRLAAAAADRTAAYGGLCTSGDWPTRLEDRPPYPPLPTDLPPLAVPPPFAHPSIDISPASALDDSRPTYINTGRTTSIHPELATLRVIGGSDATNAAPPAAATLPPSPPFYIPRSVWQPEIRV